VKPSIPTIGVDDELLVFPKALSKTPFFVGLGVRFIPLLSGLSDFPLLKPPPAAHRGDDHKQE